MQALALFVFLCFGAALCVTVTAVVVALWRLPWREALMYFGLAPYPHEQLAAVETDRDPVGIAH
jgi:hypothetical protein